MYTIKKSVNTSIEIKKSIFIGFLYKVHTKDDIDKCLSDIKEKYKDATHYCYAYIIDNSKKASDDNEPSGTAGIVIMDVLEKRKLNYILCVVVRYFGGIKLGAGGLIRAYSKISRNVSDLAEIIELVDGYLVQVTASYNNIKRLDYLVKSCTILNKTFEKDVCYTVLVDKKKFEELKEFNVKILDSVKIEKEKL